MIVAFCPLCSSARAYTRTYSRYISNIYVRVSINIPSPMLQRLCPGFPLSRAAESLPATEGGSLPFLLPLFLPSSSLPTDYIETEGRISLRDWIKIAGAISRTHDIGENATEALIMAGYTARGSSRYHVLPLNSRLSLR